MLALQEELTPTENKIAFARQANDAVTPTTRAPNNSRPCCLPACWDSTSVPVRGRRGQTARLPQVKF
jgi:hypothetical protein